MRAIAIFEKALGPDHPHLAYPLTGLGNTLLALDRPGEALAHLERALTIRTSKRGDATLLATTRFALARALWSAPVGQGRDRDRARELAELAHDTYVNASEKSAEDLSEVEVWLREHPS
jgi:tetratricopeptide (TPR) repeat protein